MTIPERVERYGAGSVARRRACRRAAVLWDQGTAARAMFKPGLGGWVVMIYGPLRTPGD